MLGSWSVTNGAVQMLGSLQLDFSLPQGKTRRDQPARTDGDSRMGKVTAAMGMQDDGGKVCVSRSSKVQGVGMGVDQSWAHGAAWNIAHLAGV